MTSPATPENAQPQQGFSRPWLDHYEQSVPKEFEPSPRTVPQLLKETAQKHPTKTAMTFIGGRTNYRTLHDNTLRLAAALQKMGVKPGDRVSIMLPNCPQSVTSFYGTLTAGAVVVNTSPLYTAHELEHQLIDSGSETLIILDTFLPRYLEVRDRVPVKRVLVTGIQDALPFPKNVLYPIKARKDGNWVEVIYDERILPFKAVIDSQTPYPTAVRIAPEEVALLQYTGGTTGIPKGAMLTHRNLVANAEQSRVWMGDIQEGKEVTLAAIPFFHVYGMTVGMNLSVMSAANIVLVPDARNIKMVLDEIQKNKATLFPGVPTLYNAINNHPDTPKHDLSSIRACISGSAPLLLETANKFKWITHGANLVEGYGLTEASPTTHVNPIFGEQAEGSIGLPLPGVDAIIVDDDGNMVPIGGNGELWISGPMIMQGYWQRPDETAKTLVEKFGQLWLKTGDIASMDERGFFKIVDRKKDLIIAGGYNIYPREVEEILMMHPAVLEAAAVGVPDLYRGESVHAVLALKPGQQVSEDEIKAFCRQELSAYKVPRSVEFRSELPKTAALKILRRQLAAEARERLEHQKE